MSSAGQPSNTSSGSTGDHFVVHALHGRPHEASALLRQLSSELFDPLTGDRLGLRQCSVSGCDSSNCLFCQGLSHGPFCSPLVSDRVCSWLGRHLSAEAVRAFRSSTAYAQGQQPQQVQQQHQRHWQQDSHGLQERQQLHAGQQHQHEQQPRQQKQPRQQEQQQQRPQSPPQQLPSTGSADGDTLQLDEAPCPKRARLRRPQSVSDFTDGSESAWASCSDTVQLARSCSRANTGNTSSSEDELLSTVRPWRWQRRFEKRKDPAPAALQEVAMLTPEQPQGGAGAGAWKGRRGHCDIVCALEFSADGRLLASAGISKQVRLYALDALWASSSSSSGDDDDDDDDDCGDRHNACLNSHTAPGAAAASSCVPHCPPVAVLRMPSKISSCAWSPDVEGVMTVGDYDGTISQVHVASGHQLNDVDAHAGRRIWSVRHSTLTRHLAASGSEDRCAKLWAGPGLAHCAAVIHAPSRSAVCCVDFSNANEHLLALACSDHNVYVYDLRASAAPLVSLKGHARPVSYVRFFGAQRLASASTDGTLAVWELGSGDAAWQQGQWQQGGLLGSPAAASGAASTGRAWRHSSTCQLASQQQQQQLSQLAAQPVCTPWKPPCLPSPWKTFAGHANERNFVGLAVRPEDGLLACGSEGTDAFVYHTSWSTPLARASAGYCAASADSMGSAGAGSGVVSGGGLCDAGNSYGSSGGEGCGAGAQAKVAQQSAQHYVSAVAWQQRQAQHATGAPALLAAASTQGSIKLLSLVVP